MPRNLPLVVGVGGPKCGSTYLASLVALHPQINPPANNIAKEVNFFTNRYDNFKNGLYWYMEQFVDKPGSIINMDISPSYFSDVSTTSLIKSVNIPVKIVIILRDPAKRAISSFIHHKRSLRIERKCDFWTATKLIPSILDDSMYEKHVSRFIKEFGNDNVFIMLLEDLKKNPLENMNQLFQFIGVHPLSSIEAGNASAKINAASLPRSFAVERAVRKGYAWAKEVGLGTMADAVRKQFGESLLQRFNRHPPGEQNQALIEQLNVNFKPTLQYVRELTGRTDLPWG